MESNKATHQVREAVANDCHQIVELIKLSALDRNMKNLVTIDAEILIRDGFTENEVPSFKCLVSHNDDQQLSGYLIYCYCYSTWEGQSVFQIRNQDTLPWANMIIKLAKIAYAENIARVDFAIHDDNQLLMDFYQSLGAVNITDKTGWNFLRLKKDAIEHLANIVMKVAIIEKEIHQVREAAIGDCHQIIQAVKMLARYHNLEDVVTIDAAALVRDVFTENSVPSLKCLVSYTNQRFSGFLTYFYTYSAYEGRSIWIDNIFVHEQFRKLGIGKRMMIKLAQIAYAENISLIEVSILDSNQLSMDFHQSLRFINLTKEDGLNIFQFDENSIRKLAEN